MFYGVVNGGTRYSVLFIFHVDIQRLHIKMMIDRIYFFEYRKTFRRFPETFLFQKPGKYLAYLILSGFHCLPNCEVTDLSRSA